jgi:ATPase subunit of ABC transporter with duplicated ATPase domains
MTALRFLGVEVAFNGQQPTIFGLDLHFSPGWTGVVGDNGAGKSTLLRLACKTVAPTGGQIIRDPGDLRVAMCPQGSAEFDDSVRTLATSDHYLARRWRGRLHCDVEQLERWTSLSLGERKRWQIAAALACDPDVLALDEPTNHLDQRVRDQLIVALSSFRGIGLLVSHDRALLNGLCTSTARVHRGTAVIYPGGYQAARALWEAETDARRTARAEIARELAGLGRRLAAAQGVQVKAERNTSTGARMKSRYDSDARSMGESNSAARAAASAGGKVARLRRAVDRAEAELATSALERERGGSLFIHCEPSPRRWLVTLEGVDLWAGHHLVAPAVHCAISRNSRIHLVGDNGTGKSTLLRALLAASRLPEERVLYLPQDYGETDESSSLNELRALIDSELGHVGQIAAALGLDPKRALSSPSPSPGEVRKLALAFGLARQAWLLILDEPTNHLDLPSIERLEDALRHYPGAMVVVSHDHEFATSITNEQWRVVELSRS